MHYFFKSLAAAALVAPMALGAQIDQSQTDASNLMAQFDQVDLAQSFKPSAATIAGAGFYMYPGYGSGASTLTVSLWDLLPNVFGATMLRTGSTGFSSSGRWVDVFWAPVGVTPAQTYYLVFSSTVDTYVVGGDDTGFYTDGQLFANSGFQTSQTYNAPGFPNNPDCLSSPCVESFANYDYAFRTFATVPEPASVTLMAGGLLALYGVARRRKAKA